MAGGWPCLTPPFKPQQVHLIGRTSRVLRTLTRHVFAHSNPYRTENWNTGRGPSHHHCHSTHVQTDSDLLASPVPTGGRRGCAGTARPRGVGIKELEWRALRGMSQPIFFFFFCRGGHFNYVIYTSPHSTKDWREKEEGCVGREGQGAF